MEEHLQSLQPEESSCRTPPIQPWFTAEQLVVNEINLDDYDTNSGSSAKNKNIAALESVQATIHTISEMLQEECSMLLRKSTQAINKTK